MKRITMADLQAWADEHRQRAEAALLARAFAETERERVDAYVVPIFQSFGFVDEDGDPIGTPDRLYLCPDDARCADFYAACDVAHRDHGWTGEGNGTCPALVAESLQIVAENALLEASASIGLGLSANRSLDLRARALDLLLGICFADGKGRTADEILKGRR